MKNLRKMVKLLKFVSNKYLQFFIIYFQTFSIKMQKKSILLSF